MTEREPDGTGPLTAPFSTYVYNALGLVTQQTDPNNNSTLYFYTPQYYLASIIDARGGVTQFGYDTEGHLKQLTDAQGNKTQFAYDRLDRMIKRTDSAGQSTQYGYDTVGNLKSIKDRRGLVREFDYDPGDRLTTERWKSGASTLRTFTYTYDVAGQLLSASDTDAAGAPLSRLAFTYDGLGRIETVNNAGTPTVPQVLLTYSYDAASRLTQVADSLGGYVTTAYDNADRPTQINQAGTNVTSKQANLSYNKRGQVTSLARYHAGTLVTQANLTYDFMGRLTDLKHTNSANVIQDRFELTYDAGSRVTSVRTTPTAPLPQYDTTFSYDATNQLTGVTSALQGESYSFDLAGNRKTSTAGTASQSYTTKDNRITNDGKYSYVYDKEGNLLSKRHLATGQTTFYTWDHRNRLTRVETRATSSPTSTLLMQAVYVYDVFDRRISKDVDSDGAGTTAVTTRESYVYDGPHITIEFRDPDASGPQPSALGARRLYGAAVDQILAEEQYPAGGGASSVYWPLTDWLGSVRDLVNSSGAVVKHIDYDSFGNAIRVADGSGNASTLNAGPSTRILWTGREFDSETKLQYNRARYYDAAIGRWLSEDPIGFDSGDANLYRYVGNAATNFTDPLGLQQKIPSLAEAKRKADQRLNDARKFAGEGRSDAEKAVDRTGNRLRAGVAGVGTGIQTITPVLIEFGISLISPEGKIAEIVVARGGKLIVSLAGRARRTLSPKEVERLGRAFGITGKKGDELAEAVAARLREQAETAARASLSNEEARRWYIGQVKQLKLDVPATEANARAIHAERNALKRRTRDLMAERAEVARLDKNYPLQDFDCYVKKYKAQGFEGEALWRRIIEGGGTTNPDVNQTFGIGE